MSRLYEVDLFVKGDVDELDHFVGTVQLKSITQVAKFLDTVDFSYINTVVYTPKNNYLNAQDILKIWRS